MRIIALPFCIVTFNLLSQHDTLHVTSTDDSIHISGLMDISFSNEEASLLMYDNGIQAALKGDYGAAVSHFTSALLFDAHNPDIWYHRGLSYYYLDDYPSAISDLTQTLALSPADTSALSQRGVTYARSGDTALALQDLNELIRVNPRSGSGHYNKAIVYLQMDKLGPACDLLRKADELHYEAAASVLSMYCE
jgi:Flp pilus assembly protein TadD